MIEKERLLLRRRDALPALSALGEEGLAAWAAERGLPAYRARQVQHALEVEGAQTFEDLTVLPRALRQSLSTQYRLRSLERRMHLVSKSDRAEKVLFGLGDGGTVESVLIRSPRRETVCVSSQVGCPAGCTFCATGLGGFSRNLTAEEIVDQVMYFAYRLRAEGKRVSNVVYMGMGEPLLNVGAVRASVTRLTDPHGYGLGARSITISTVGIVPQLRRFADWAGQINLAISLHAGNDELRRRLVPYNEHFPIGDIMSSVREYVAVTNRRVSFEYVLLRGVNDTAVDAEQTAALLRPLGGLAHVNLIPWNPFREGRFMRSEGPDADAFLAALTASGVHGTIRYSKGLDISAACGQLREAEAAAVAAAPEA